jgi:hypothetical protein
LQCNVDKKLTNDVFVLVDELDNNRVNMIKEISKDTKVLCCYEKEVKNSLDVNYIVNKKPKNDCPINAKETSVINNANPKYEILRIGSINIFLKSKNSFNHSKNLFLGFPFLATNRK